MKYYLKAIGDSNCLKPDEDLMERLGEKDVDMKFWENSCKIWFNSMPELHIGDIFIIYVVKHDPRNEGVFGWRILGYCEVASNKEDTFTNLEGKWFKYVMVNNLAKIFSEKSKTREILNIEDFNISFNMGTIRRGYSELDEKTANIIIKAINKNN